MSERILKEQSKRVKMGNLPFDKMGNFPFDKRE